MKNIFFIFLWQAGPLPCVAFESLFVLKKWYYSFESKNCKGQKMQFFSDLFNMSHIEQIGKN